jgi:hypothetical protein
MSQGESSLPFTITELMNIILGPILDPDPELSLLHLDSPQELAPLSFYMDDIFGGFTSIDSMISFLRDHFLPRILWAGLRLSFKKLKIGFDKITVLGITHRIGAEVQILEERTRKIAEWPVPEISKTQIPWKKPRTLLARFIFCCS